jgi:hypothetical protein
MKRTIIFYFFILYSFFSTDIFAHGFGEWTYVSTSRNNQQRYEIIKQVCQESLEETITIFSYDQQVKTPCIANVKRAAQSTAPWYIKINFEQQSYYFNISCSPLQEFYLPEYDYWVPAYALEVGDELLSQDGSYKAITHIEYVNEPLTVYIFQVDGQHHTFFVGSERVLVHNMALAPVIQFGLAVAFGTGASGGGASGSFFGPPAMMAGLTFGGILGLALHCIFPRDELPSVSCGFDVGRHERIYVFNEQPVEQKEPSNPGTAPAQPEQAKDKKTVDDVLKDIANTEQKKRKTRQFKKKGTYEDAQKDFESLQPKNVRKVKEALVGDLDDGRIVNIRSKSSANAPTLEIYNPEKDRSIKIRYIAA